MSRLKPFLAPLLILAASVTLGLLTVRHQWAKAPARLRHADQLRAGDVEAPRPPPKQDAELATFSLPAFSFKDQDGKPFTEKDVAGHVTVVDFIFTQCSGTCPAMTARMAKLATELPPGVRFVSFSVDPASDTPEALRKFGERFGADFTRWTFVATDKQNLLRVCKAVGLLPADATDKDAFIHSEKFLLIDAAGKGRGMYDSLQEDQVEKLVADARRLVE